LTTSKTVSCGGSTKPPGIPACMRGIRVESRKVSQLSLVSCTAMMVQPSADGPPAWNCCPGGRLPSAGWTAAIEA